MLVTWARRRCKWYMHLRCSILALYICSSNWSAKWEAFYCLKSNSTHATMEPRTFWGVLMCAEATWNSCSASTRQSISVTCSIDLLSHLHISVIHQIHEDSSVLCNSFHGARMWECVIAHVATVLTHTLRLPLRAIRVRIKVTLYIASLNILKMDESDYTL